MVVKTVSSSKFKPLDPNRLVENTSFPKHNLPAFIPAFKILRHYNTDIITLYVPQQIDLDTLKECIESPKAKVLDVQRLNRRSVRDGKVEYIPGQYVQDLQDNCRKRSSYTRLDMRFAPSFLDRGCAIFIIEWDTLAVRVRADVCIAAKISIICAAPIRKLLNVLILTVIGLMIITALSANSVLLSAWQLLKIFPLPMPIEAINDKSLSFSSLFSSYSNYLNLSSGNGNTKFENFNRFDFLNGEEPEKECLTYANVLKSRSHSSS